MNVTPSDVTLWNTIHACVASALSTVDGDFSAAEEDVVADACRTVSDLTPSKIAGLTELMAEVRDRPNTLAKFELPATSNESAAFVSPQEIAQIPIVLATNALRKFGTRANEVDLTHDYLPYERYLLSDPKFLSADLLVPILGVEPGEFSSESTPLSLQRINGDVVATLASNRHRQNVSDYDQHVLRSASVCLRIPSGTVRVEGFGRSHYSSLAEDTTAVIDRFFDALTLAAPRSAAWAEYAIMPAGWLAWPRSSLGTANILRGHANTVDKVAGIYRDVSLLPLDSQATDLAMQLDERLQNCHRSIRVAASRFRRALGRDNDDDRVVDLCIALEAVLGTDVEIVHRLSMRTAGILAASWSAPSEHIYKATKELYKHRSRVVHGNSSKYEEGMVTLGDGPPVHVSRYGAAAVSSVVKRLTLDTEFSPQQLDRRYIFALLDQASGVDGAG